MSKVAVRIPFVSSHSAVGTQTHAHPLHSTPLRSTPLYAQAASINPSIPLASVNRIVKRVLPAGVQISKDSKLAFARASGVFVLYVTAACVSLVEMKVRADHWLWEERERPCVGPHAPRAPALHAHHTSRLSRFAIALPYPPPPSPPPLPPLPPRSHYSANDFCQNAGRQTISVDDVLNALRELEFDDMMDPLESFLEGACEWRWSTACALHCVYHHPLFALTFARTFFPLSPRRKQHPPKCPRAHLNSTLSLVLPHSLTQAYNTEAEAKKQDKRAREQARAAAAAKSSSATEANASEGAAASGESSSSAAAAPAAEGEAAAAAVDTAAEVGTEAKVEAVATGGAKEDAGDAMEEDDAAAAPAPAAAAPAATEAAAAAAGDEDLEQGPAKRAKVEESAAAAAPAK